MAMTRSVAPPPPQHQVSSPLPTSPPSPRRLCDRGELGKWRGANHLRSDGDSAINAASGPPIPLLPFFKQVYSPHIGYVDPLLIRDTLWDLKAMVEREREAAEGAVGEVGASTDSLSHNLSTSVVLFAIDGTLLNMMRWGRVQNDNDVDLGFYFPPSSSPSAAEAREGGNKGDRIVLSAFHVMDQYYRMLDLLAKHGIIHSPSSRDRKRLHSSTEGVKVGKCKHRGQLMQCRHKTTGVYIDLFGPDTLFSQSQSQPLRPSQMFPITPCRSFNFDFPCPRKALEVLTTVSLNLNPRAAASQQKERSQKDERQRGSGDGADESKRKDADEKKRDFNEFKGCPLFPLDPTEQTVLHLASIVAEGERLDACGYPNLLRGTLLEERRRITERQQKEGGEAPPLNGEDTFPCTQMLKKVGGLNY